jgi:AcrR family transcriptional regulator
MTAVKGARERARVEITGEIVAEARRQLAVHGASALSLRSVARELGMVSSAVYRYVASRDELLTLLIVEAYDSLGAAAERAASRSTGNPPVERFVTVATAIRRWARAHPHEYALVYGSPVPGYAAPPDTIAPAARVSLALAGVVVDAHHEARLRRPPGPPIEIPPALAADLAAVAGEFGADLDDEVTARLIAAWTQLFGLVGFELFGQTHGLITAHTELFTATTTAMAHFVGLADTAP